MLPLVYSRDILIEIILNGHPFTDAVKKVLRDSKLDFNVQGLIRSLTSCELHHHLLLKHVVNLFFSELEEDKKILLQTAIGNQVFIKRLPEAEVTQYIKEFLENNGVAQDKIDAFFLHIAPGKRLIAANVPENSSLYLSLKYNTPEWLVAMWQKHYGASTAMKILQSNGKAVLQACRINSKKTTVQDVLSLDKEFIAGPIPETVIYQGKEPLKNRQVYLDNLVFQQRLAVTDIINQISFDNLLGEVLIVEGRPNALYLELPLVAKETVPINVATNSIERKVDMQKAIAHFQLKNVNVFESTVQGLIAHVSHQQDFVLVVPNCSKFDLIRSLPDFFIHFRQEELDPLIQEQRLALEESSQFVVEGGLLVYGINTMNNKEGHLLVAEFMQRHGDAFKLVLEKQYIPSDPFNTALYVAALRKVA